jgi:hypothetical protein
MPTSFTDSCVRVTVNQCEDDVNHLLWFAVQMFPTLSSGDLIYNVLTFTIVLRVVYVFVGASPSRRAFLLKGLRY